MFMTKKAKWCVGILSGLLAVVTAVLIYILTGEGAWMVQTPPQDSFLSYLSSKENLYDTETGILHTVRTFRACIPRARHISFRICALPRQLMP